MIGKSNFIRMFAVCSLWHIHWLLQTFRINKETLSSFRGSDKTTKFIKTPREQRSNCPYLHIKVRAFCYTVGCLGSWSYLQSHRSRKFPCLFSCPYLNNKNTNDKIIFYCINKK